MTNGWEAGSLTANAVSGADVLVSHADEPWSPEEASIVCPWVAASWNRVFSALVTLVGSFVSHLPSDADRILA